MQKVGEGGHNLTILHSSLSKISLQAKINYSLLLYFFSPVLCSYNSYWHYSVVYKLSGKYIVKNNLMMKPIDKMVY